MDKGEDSVFDEKWNVVVRFVTAIIGILCLVAVCLPWTWKIWNEQLAYGLLILFSICAVEFFHTWSKTEDKTKDQLSVTEKQEVIDDPQKDMGAIPTLF